jgi:hypothetical protein
VILNPNDPSALLGVDNPLAPEDIVNNPSSSQNSDSDMDVDVRNVTMVVVDGIVVGTKVCRSALCDDYFLNIIYLALCL